MSQPAELNVLNWNPFEEKRMLNAKEIHIWHYLTGNKENKCTLTKALKIASGGDDEMEIIKAELKLEKAIQMQVKFMWNSLHPFDQNKVKMLMVNDDLKGMWNTLKVKPTQETVDQLLEKMAALKCDPRDPVSFINACQEHQERLHSSKIGEGARPIAECIRSCVSRLPTGEGWANLKLTQHDDPPGRGPTSWRR